MVDGCYIKGKYYNMTAGRGCYGRCSFCSIHKSEGITVRIYRSPQNVVDEMQSLKKEYGISHIWFNDEIFYDRSKKGRLWMNEFCTELEKRNLNLSFNIEMRPNDINEEELIKLKKVGLTAIFVGIESGIQRLLDEMRKDVTVEQNIEALRVLKKLDIKVEMGWIAIVPTMSFDELVKNYEFLFSTNCYTEENIYNRFNLYGGCYYEDILRKMGLLNKNNLFYDRFGYSFIDIKVGCFAKIMEDLRGEFKNIKKKTFSVQERTSLSGDYSEYLRIRDIQRAMWTTITKGLLEYIQKKGDISYMQFKMTDTYKMFEKQINCLEKCIENHRLIIPGLFEPPVRTL